jgi:PucR C-terminal helix-turn-helix domain/GGDEF-like domain
MLSYEDRNRKLRPAVIGNDDGELEELRRRLVARARAATSELLDPLTARYRHELASHGVASHPVDAGVARRLALSTIEAILGAVEAGAESPGGVSCAQGEESVLLSVLPAPALLAALGAASGMTWRLLSQEITTMGLSSRVSAKLLAAVGETLFDVSARLNAPLRHRLEANGNGHPPASDAPTKQAVFNALLVNPELGERTLADAADRAGFPRGETYVVAIAVPERSGLSTGAWASGEVAAIEDLLSAVDTGTHRPVVLARASDVVAIYASKKDFARRHLARRVADAIREAGQPEGVTIHVAIGGEHDGFVGVAASYEQASRTLEASLASRGPDRVVAYPEMLPILLLLENPRVRSELRRCTVDLLDSHDADRQDQLVATLEALHAERGNVSAAAARLGVHRHTLAGRQTRIERITGMRFQDPRDWILLELGLRATQIDSPFGEEGGGRRPDAAAR